MKKIRFLNQFFIFILFIFVVSGCETLRTVIDDGREDYEKYEKDYRYLEGKVGKKGLVKVQNGYDEYKLRWTVVETLTSNAKIFKGKEEYGKEYLSPGESVDIETLVFKDQTTDVEFLVKVYEYDKEQKDVVFRYSYQERRSLYWDKRTEVFICNR